MQRVDAGRFDDRQQKRREDQNRGRRFEKATGDQQPGIDEQQRLPIGQVQRAHRVDQVLRNAACGHEPRINSGAGDDDQDLRDQHDRADDDLTELGKIDLTIDEHRYEQRIDDGDAGRLGRGMVAAILGAALVEYVLEETIKLRLRRDDVETWERMIDANGPLRDFHAKILTGFALGIFNEEIKINLNLVRDIRNVFAHAKIDLGFDNPTLGDALVVVRPIRSGKRILNPGSLSHEPTKRAYLQLCFSLFTFFQIKLRSRLRGYERRIRHAQREQQFLNRMLQVLRDRRQN
jgi:hypothetical protein